ncbi:hypothetical protein BN1007_70604 [Klebsiella variicola]|nr:hypothetical protein BN1007_70604 [Klebsiella variicola]
MPKLYVVINNLFNHIKFKEWNVLNKYYLFTIFLKIAYRLFKPQS